MPGALSVIGIFFLVWDVSCRDRIEEWGAWYESPLTCGVIPWQRYMMGTLSESGPWSKHRSSLWLFFSWKNEIKGGSGEGHGIIINKACRQHSVMKRSLSKCVHAEYYSKLYLEMGSRIHLSVLSKDYMWRPDCPNNLISPFAASLWNIINSPELYVSASIP